MGWWVVNCKPSKLILPKKGFPSYKMTTEGVDTLIPLSGISRIKGEPKLPMKGGGSLILWLISWYVAIRMNAKT